MSGTTPSPIVTAALLVVVATHLLGVFRPSLDVSKVLRERRNELGVGQERAERRGLRKACGSRVAILAFRSCSTMTRPRWKYVAVMTA